jgi:hypothetical protein
MTMNKIRIQELGSRFSEAAVVGIKYSELFNLVVKELRDHFKTWDEFKPYRLLFSKSYQRGLLKRGIAPNKRSAEGYVTRLYKKVFPDKKKSGTGKARSPHTLLQAKYDSTISSGRSTGSSPSALGTNQAAFQKVPLDSFIEPYIY